MGLDFSHGHAHWAYSGFHRFRERLAQQEGFDLNEMAGFCSEWRGHDPATHPARSWEEITTPLKPLLDHSDCDGELTADECAQVEPRLRGVIATWPPDDYDRQHGEALADAMRACADSGESLEFC